MSLTVAYRCWLPRTVSMVTWSCCMSLNVFYGCLLSLTTSQSHRVARCLSLSHIVAGCLSLTLRSHEVAACRSLSPMVIGCLSLSLLVPWNCCMSFTFFFGCWLFLTVSPSPLELLLHVFHCCWLSLTISSGPMQLLNVSYSHVLLLAVSRLHGTGSKLRDSQQQLETVKDLKQLHGAGEESERQPATMRDSDKRAATPSY